jgi:hypothetical protein
MSEIEIGWGSRHLKFGHVRLTYTVASPNRRVGNSSSVMTHPAPCKIPLRCNVRISQDERARIRERLKL